MSIFDPIFFEMEVRSKHSIGLNSPASSDNANDPNSPAAKSLTKRQEQNRSAQRAFRERRAKMLTELDSRLGRIESVLDVVAYQARRISDLDREVKNLQDLVQNLEASIESASMPLWSVPNVSQGLLPSSSPIEIPTGAMRPSSTDPSFESINSRRMHDLE